MQQVALCKVAMYLLKGSLGSSSVQNSSCIEISHGISICVCSKALCTYSKGLQAHSSLQNSYCIEISQSIPICIWHKSPCTYSKGPWAHLLHKTHPALKSHMTSLYACVATRYVSSGCVLTQRVPGLIFIKRFILHRNLLLPRSAERIKRRLQRHRGMRKAVLPHRACAYFVPRRPLPRVFV